MLNWSNIQFVNPEAFVLLLLLPAVGFWYYKKRKDYYATIKMSSLQSLAGVRSWRGRLRSLLPFLRILSGIALVIALARPQEVLKEEDITSEGIDISLVMDLSSSMLAQDFKPDRLEASKKVAADFVDKRPYDRIGPRPTHKPAAPGSGHQQATGVKTRLPTDPPSTPSQPTNAVSPRTPSRRGARPTGGGRKPTGGRGGGGGGSAAAAAGRTQRRHGAPAAAGRSSPPPLPPRGPRGTAPHVGRLRGWVPHPP